MCIVMDVHTLMTVCVKSTPRAQCNIINELHAGRTAARDMTRGRIIAIILLFTVPRMYYYYYHIIAGNGGAKRCGNAVIPIYSSCTGYEDSTIKSGTKTTL